MNTDLVFGPVPSRRLGMSLGINHIPPKTCPYACVYCQVGQTTALGWRRQQFYRPELVIEGVKTRIAQLLQAGKKPDYVTLVPDGEPTLDANLGVLIEGLRQLGWPVAVISNGALLDQPAVRAELALANWVSVKVDAAEHTSWRDVNRPHGQLCLEDILAGALTFREEFEGKLATETMLVRGVNDGETAVSAVADFLAQLQPDVAYLAVPTRPPAEAWVASPTTERLHHAYQLLSTKVPQVEYLIGFEGTEFTPLDDAATELLRITAVHPLRRDQVEKLLADKGQDWAVVEQLTNDERLAEISYGGHTYYQRRLPT